MARRKKIKVVFFWKGYGKVKNMFINRNNVHKLGWKGWMSGFTWVSTGSTCKFYEHFVDL
jgi:hypothetical protein